MAQKPEEVSRGQALRKIFDSLLPRLEKYDNETITSKESSELVLDAAIATKLLMVAINEIVEDRKEKRAAAEVNSALGRLGITEKDLGNVNDAD